MHWFKWVRKVFFLWFVIRARSLRVLWDKLQLLKPMDVLGSFGFCKICMISCDLPQGAQKNSCFFVNVLWCTISSWNFFHKCDTPNLIYVIIHVEKTFRSLHCQKCGKYFKKKQRITEHLKVQVDNIEISDTFYKIQNFLGTLWSLIIATCLIKLLRMGPIDELLNWELGRN